MFDFITDFMLFAIMFPISFGLNFNSVSYLPKKYISQNALNIQTFTSDSVNYLSVSKSDVFQEARCSCIKIHREFISSCFKASQVRTAGVKLTIKNVLFLLKPSCDMQQIVVT